MRTLMLLPLFAMAACQVSTDDQNDSVSLSYNEDVAAEAAADATNLAEDVASDVSNTADKVSDEVGDINVNVSTDGDEAPANAN